VREAKTKRRYSWEFALIGVTLVWGFTFPIVKCAVQLCPGVHGGLGLANVGRPTTPLMFLAIRFAIAASLVGVASLSALRTLTSRQLVIGCAIGLALAGSFIFQTFGLQRTSASNAGFLTGLYVILTPLFGAAFLRRVPPPSTVAGALLAVVGLLLIASPSGVGLGLGDALVLGCAAMAAIHILLLGRFAGIAPVRALATVQLGVIAIVTGVASVAVEREPVPTDGGIWIAILICAVFASALAFLIQTGAQRFIPPARAAVILVMEAPFAALFGYLMLDERLGARGLIGAALIVSGILVAELLAPAKEEL
jgi:drug/metabolite transporter (DMT)-like permease